jgi:hypothetical protein
LVAGGELPNGLADHLVGWVAEQAVFGLVHAAHSAGGINFMISNGSKLE